MPAVDSGQDVQVSVVIPTFNMSEHLDGLWSSLKSSGLYRRVREIIIVDDGSTDGTPARVEEFIAQSRDPITEVRSVRLPVNSGRFSARLAGARAARSEFLLFLDTRLELPATFADKLFAYLPDDRCLQGLTRIRPDRSLFDLYWDRTHLFLFRRYFREVERGLLITESNYDRYVTGTTVFACPREVFLAACEQFENTNLLSDDTALLRHIVRTHPIHVRPDFEFYWFPRQRLGSFLGRLWERGPSFVEYHIFESRGVYFAACAGAVVILAVQMLMAMWAAPVLGVSTIQLAGILFGLNLIAIVLTTALFARGAVEFIKLAALHVVVVAVAAGAVVRGLFVHLARRGLRQPRSVPS